MTGRTPYLLVEFVAIFLGFPAMIHFGFLPKFPIPLLIFSAAACLAWLRFSGSITTRELFGVDFTVVDAKVVLIRFLFLCSVLGVAVALIVPENLFSLFKRSRALWAIVMIGYPLFSVYPQEIIFRSFVFHRYKELLGEGVGFVVVNSLVFGLAHIIFGNWISVVLSFFGSVLFSLTYLRTRSLLLVGLEHALYGQFIFTIGLGVYFYHGAVHS